MIKTECCLVDIFNTTYQGKDYTVLKFYDLNTGNFYTCNSTKLIYVNTDYDSVNKSYMDKDLCIYALTLEYKYNKFVPCSIENYKLA